MQIALTHRIAVDSMARDQAVDLLGAVAQRVEKPLAIHRAQPLGQLFRRNPRPGVDQARIATGCAVADLRSLQQEHRFRAFFGQMQSGGKPRESGTNDDVISRQMTIQRLRCRGRNGRFSPKPVRVLRNVHFLV